MSTPFGLTVDGLGVQAFGPGAEALVDGPAPAAGRRPRLTDTPVLVIHGTMDRSSGFRRLQRRLDGVPVVLYDRRGYATSRSGGLSPSIAEQVDDAREVLMATCREAAIVVGHSLGGLLALHLAATSPGLVAGLVVFEPPMPWLPWYGESAGSTARQAVEADGPEVAAEAFMRHIVGSELWERLPSAMQAERRAEGAALIADLELVRTDAARYDPTAIKVPLVAGYGSESPERFRRSAKVLADEVRGAELVVIDESSHGVHLSHPQQLADVVLRLRDRVRSVPR